MARKILNALISGSRDLLHNWRVLIVMFVLYLAMFGAAYEFLQTREATAGLFLFSLFVGDLVSKTGGNATPTTIREVARSLPTPPRPVAPKPQPISWQAVAITTLRYLIFFLILPLAAIHLWIATARDGLKQSLGRSAKILGRSFAPKAVVTYLIGFIFFAVVPYFLVVTKTPAGSAWLDAGLLVVRLLLAMAFSLAGWVVTVGALGELSEASRASDVAQTNEGTGHVPAEA